MAQEGNTVKDRFDALKREIETEMDLDAIFEDEYKAVLAEEIAEDVRAQARKEAEEEMRRRRMTKGISR